MKILLDESLPRKLRYDFEEGHKVFSVRDMGWLGKKNGELIKLIIEEGFELFITVDRNIPYQQNLEKITFTTIILCGVDNRRDTLKLLIPKLFSRLTEAELQKVIEIS